MASKLRTSEARSGGGAAMRKRLLDAAVECMVEFGVAGTTTLAVQRRADVSRGALLHHFPSHAALLAASVAELVKRNERAVAFSRSGRPEPAEPLEAAIRALAFAARQPAYLAELELWAVARTDGALRHALVSVERTARREIDRVYADLFGKWAESDTYQDLVSLTQHFMRGLAISESLGISDRRRERAIAAWADAMRAMIERDPKETQRKPRQQIPRKHRIA